MRICFYIYALYAKRFIVRYLNSDQKIAENSCLQESKFGFSNRFLKS